jgi:hypothetical protein
LERAVGGDALRVRFQRDAIDLSRENPVAATHGPAAPAPTQQAERTRAAAASAAAAAAHGWDAANART